jgi:hypothetical protein
MVFEGLRVWKLDIVFISNFLRGIFGFFLNFKNVPIIHERGKWLFVVCLDCR